MLKRHLAELFLIGWIAISFWYLAVPRAYTQEPSGEKTVAAGESAKADEINADELQRTEARKHIPELLIFLAVAVTLAVAFRLKAHDLEKLREEGFFRKRHGS